MKRVGVFLGVLVLAVTAAGAVACNGVLGIGSASLADTVETEAGVTCPFYCQTMSANCTGNSTEFQSLDSLCLSMCNDLSLDTGNIAASNDNTLGCRIFYAEQAGKSDAVDNFRFAGPLGGDRCGTRRDACTNFCALDVPYCQHIGVPSYPTTIDCMNACMTGGDAGAGFTFVLDGGDGTMGVDLPEGTDTLNCRYYHLENAYPSKARGMTHCPHTQPVSATCF